MTAIPEPYGVMYEFAPDYDATAPKEATAAIRLLDPDLKGIVFRYDTISVKEVEAEDSAHIEFTYTVLDGDIKDTTEFELRLGNLLHDILLLSLEAQ